MKRILAILIILLAAGTAHAAWYDTDYNHFKTITINHAYVNGTVTNHPLLVDITDTDLRDKAQADGDDIIFVNSANTTQLDHQIESDFNSTTGHLIAWVRVPSITNTSDTVINMYYNYSVAINSENPSGVWGLNASGIWLMDEGTGSWANDSSSNTNNGSLEDMASPPTSISGWNDLGKIDGCLQFDGSNDRVDCGNDSSFNGGDVITISAWIKADTNDGFIMSKRIQGSDNAYDFYIDGASDMGFAIWINNIQKGGSFTSAPMTLGAWMYVVGIYNGSAMKVYVDGVEKEVMAGISGDIDTTIDPVRIGWGYSSGYNFDGLIDFIQIYNRTLSAAEIATTYNNTNDPANFSTVGTEQSQAVGTPDPINLDHTKDTTWVNHTWAAGSAPNVTDSYNVSINNTWHNTTTNAYYNNTPITSGNWSNITVWAWNSTYNELSAGSVSENVQTGAAPNITSYAPTVTIWPEVQDSQLFNITVNQSTQCRWYVNGTLRQTNSSLSTTHNYMNTSLPGGGCNVTAVANNTNGSDVQTWLFEVGADSITYIVLSEDDTNLTCLIRWNMTRVGSNITTINTSYKNTTAGCTYYKNFDNGTEILNQTATSNDEELWFNSSTLLPIGIYYINGSCPYNYITLYASEYGLINNWTTAQNCSQIDANTSNMVCGSWYNHTSGLWEGYRSGYSYNADAEIPKNNSAFIFVDAQTTVSATPHTGGVTIQNATWFYGMLPGSTAKTLTEIETAMDSDGLDVWSLYGWSNSSQAYTVTGGYSVAPNEGYAVYVNTTGEYTP